MSYYPPAIPQPVPNMLSDRFDSTPPSNLHLELYALPNDVTFVVNGTITAGDAPITAVLEIFMLNNLAVYTSVGRFAPTTQYASIPPNNVISYTVNLLPTALVTLLGPLAATQTVKARLTLTNAVSSVVQETVPTSFVINIPPPPPPPPPPVGLPITITTMTITDLGPSTLAGYEDLQVFLTWNTPAPGNGPYTVTLVADNGKTVIGTTNGPVDSEYFWTYPLTTGSITVTATVTDKITAQTGTRAATLKIGPVATYVYPAGTAPYVTQIDLYSNRLMRIGVVSVAPTTVYNVSVTNSLGVVIQPNPNSLNALGGTIGGQWYSGAGGYTVQLFVGTTLVAAAQFIITAAQAALIP